MTIIFSVSWVSRLTTLSLRVLVYPHLLHARKTFFSFFCGRRVLPHLGQNCKTLGLPVRGGLAFLTVTLSLFRRLVRARGVGRAGSPLGESGPPGPKENF